MPDSDTEAEISIKDIYSIIKNISKTNDEILKQNKEIKNDLKTYVEKTTKEIERLKTENSELKSVVGEIKDRLIIAERRNKKYNIVVYGVDEKDDDLEVLNNVLSIINSELEIQCKHEEIRDHYRLGAKKNGYNRPMLLEFTHYNLKSEILRNSKKLKGTGLFITKDYTPEDLLKRKKHKINNKNPIDTETNPERSDDANEESTGDVAPSKSVVNATAITSSKNKGAKDKHDENKKKNQSKPVESKENRKYYTRK